MEPVLVPVVWSLVAGACFSIGAIYLIAWLNRVGEREYLAFSALAISLGALTLCELAIMRSSSPQEAGEWVRWIHVPVTTAVLSIVAFMHFYLGSRRLWLGYLACGLRLVTLALNFHFEPNVSFASVTGLHSVTVLGEPAVVPVGTANPWVAFGWASSLALLLFAIDAAMTGWRKTDPIERRRAVVIGGSLILLVLFGGIYNPLIATGTIRFIYIFSIPSLIVMLAIAFELGADMMRALQLAPRLKQSEADLRRSEQRMQQAAEAAQIGIWEWRMDRDEVWATEQTRVLFGIPPDASVDFKRFLDALHPDDQASVEQAVVGIREKGGMFEQAYRARLPDHRDRWLLTRGRTEQDADGHPVLLRGVSMDITDRRHAEERYQRVVEEAPYGLLIADESGKVSFANASAATIFGYPRDELAGLSLDALIPGCLSQRQAERDGAPDSAIGVIRGRRMTGRHRDGTEGALEFGLSRVAGPEGIRLLAMVVDVSALQAAIGQIEHERAFLRQVIDTMPGLIFAKDRDGRFTLANQALADLYGCPVARLIGRTDAEVNRNAEEVRHFRAADLEVMDTRTQRLIAEEPVTGADGVTRWFMTIKVPIVSSDGTANQVLGSAVDITARKKAELEVAQQRNELAHLSRVTMLSELSGSLTHELNQPLAAILSNAQAALRFLAMAEPDLDEVREILRDIVNDDRRAGELIRGLRLMLKRGELRQTAFDANDLVRDVLKLVRGDVLNAGVALTVELADTLPMLSGDRVQLQQVLLNLIVNGCEAMSAVERRSRRLRVSTVLTDEQNVVVAVADEGTGIPDGDLERVFEPFFTTKPQGLGLGLSVCRRIIGAHGGRLWADNNPGGGSSFSFMLPSEEARKAA